MNRKNAITVVAKLRANMEQEMGNNAINVMDVGAILQGGHIWMKVKYGMTTYVENKLTRNLQQSTIVR